MAARLTLTQAEFAKRRGVSQARVSQWKTQGLVIIADDGKVDVEQSEWLLADRPRVKRGGVVKQPPADITPVERKKPGPKPKPRAEPPAAVPPPADAVAIVEASRPADVARDAAEPLADAAMRAIEGIVKQGGTLWTHAEAARIKENYLAKLRELEYDVKSGAVVEVVEVGKKVAAEYAAVRAGVLSVPSKLAPKLALVRTAEEIRDLLSVAIGEALEALTLDAIPEGA